MIEMAPRAHPVLCPPPPEAPDERLFCPVLCAVFTTFLRPTLFRYKSTTIQPIPFHVHFTQLLPLPSSTRRRSTTNHRTTPKQPRGGRTSTKQRHDNTNCGGGASHPHHNTTMQSDEMWTLPYYHALLPREDVEMLLTREGDFLVRKSEETAGQERVFVLSVYASGVVHHVLFRQRNGLIAVDLNYERGFRTIERFIDSHLETGHSICEDQPITIRQGIERKHWQLAHSAVTVRDKVLGRGMFGVVKDGTFTDPTGRNEPIHVAVKVENAPSDKLQIKQFMHEARIMRELHHQNIIKFYGVIVDREPLMIVMELAFEGNLITYFEHHKRSMRSKLFMCLGAASALDHIHCKGIIHCSVGARNCLYSQRMLKITNFGQAHKGEVKILDESKPVPIRWLAPETLRSLFFTQKSDTWSYGVLCWEIFNDGQRPFDGLTPAVVQDMVLAGERLEFPENTPQMFADFIRNNVWDPNHHMRHSMSAVYDWLDRNVNQMRGNE